MNQASLVSDVGVSSHTISEWLSVLEASFVIMRLQPLLRELWQTGSEIAQVVFCRRRPRGLVTGNRDG